MPDWEEKRKRRLTLMAECAALFRAIPLMFQALRLLVAQCSFLHGPSRAGMAERPLEFCERAKTEFDRVPGLDVGAVPMRAVAHGRDRRLRRADQLGDLGVGQLGMALQQKSNRIRLVLPFGNRCVARALVLEDLRRKGLRGKLEPRLRIGLAALALLRRGLTVRHRRWLGSPADAARRNRLSGQR